MCQVPIVALETVKILYCYSVADDKMQHESDCRVFIIVGCGVRVVAYFTESRDGRDGGVGGPIETDRTGPDRRRHFAVLCFLSDFFSGRRRLLAEAAAAAAEASSPVKVPRGA